MLQVVLYFKLFLFLSSMAGGMEEKEITENQMRSFLDMVDLNHVCLTYTSCPAVLVVVLLFQFVFFCLTSGLQEVDTVTDYFFVHVEKDNRADTLTLEDFTEKCMDVSSLDDYLIPNDLI